MSEMLETVVGSKRGRNHLGAVPLPLSSGKKTKTNKGERKSTTKADKPVTRARKVTRPRNYEAFCRRDEIPMPLINDREMDHLFNCLSCQRIWPLYVTYWNTGSLEDDASALTVKQVSENWSRMLEKERQDEYSILTQKEKIRFDRMIRPNGATGYQLFVSEHRDLLKKPKDDAGYDFHEQTRLLGQKWAGLTPDAQDVYNSTARLNNERARKKKKNLTKYERKRFRDYRKEKKRLAAMTMPPKPTNPWIMYKNERWKKIKFEAEQAQAPMPVYQDVIVKLTQDWKSNVQTDLKEEYLRRYTAERDKYFQVKKMMKKRKKENSSGTLRLPVPVHPGGDAGDMGSDDGLD